VPVPDPAHGLDLAGQPQPGVGVARDRGSEHLDGDRAVLRVAGEVDHAHAALADLLENSVRADLARE